MSEASLLTCDRLRFGYPSKPDFLGPIDLSLAAGRVLGIVGPNGAGKSTLLRLLAGLTKPAAGTVTLEDRDVHRMSPRHRAQRIAFVPQRPSLPDDVTVRQVVLLGRFPHRRLQYFDSAQDHLLTVEALRDTETLPLADRPLSTLSVGEQQRVYLAAALAQQPRLLVLDEPTAALDPYHQLALFSLLRLKAERLRLSIVVVTHDLNLAGRYGDVLLLLHGGRCAALGGPGEVLTESALEPVYNVNFEIVRAGAGGRGWIVPNEAMGSIAE